MIAFHRMGVAATLALALAAGPALGLVFAADGHKHEEDDSDHGHSHAAGEPHDHGEEAQDAHDHATDGDDGHDHGAEKSGGGGHGHGAGGHDHGHEEAAEGPRGGRLLEEGDFTVEVVLDEDSGVVSLFATEAGQAVAPGALAASMTLKRLEGETSVYAFAPDGEGLKSDAAVAEPHSFDVIVRVVHEGTAHEWAYESYEGRTTIDAAAAAEAGVKVATVGPVSLHETVDLAGRIALTPSGRADVRAWYPGRVISIAVNIGDRVKKGDEVATVEARDSLKRYVLPAPIDGVVVQRPLNVGDLAESAAVAVIVDPRAVQAELHVFPRDAERVRAGQAVEIRSLGGSLTAASKLETFLPATDAMTQTLTARALIENPQEAWRAGMAVEARVVVADIDAELAVRTSALQRLGDNTVVFIKVGDVYEARPVETGRRDSQWVEILSGLKAGQVYVTDNAFLIRADVEKSGAAHEH